MNSESLFTAALGLMPPWQVLDIQIDPDKGRIDFNVDFSSGVKLDAFAKSR